LRFKVHHRLPFLDRLYRDRDRARAERDRYQAELSAERDRYKAERDALIAEARRPRPVDSELTHVEVPPTPFGRTEALADVDDLELVSRIVAAYQASTAISPKPSQSMWEVIAEKKGDVQEALARGEIEEVQRLLREPGKTDLFYGFENLARSLNTEGPGLEPHSVMIYQDLLFLAEATGVKRRWNPANSTSFPLPSIDELLALIDEGVGCDRANIFLSINHEVNPFTVHKLYAAIATPAVIRTPYWMRAGYVEEIFVNK
jgi:hypothetical protein